MPTVRLPTWLLLLGCLNSGIPGLARADEAIRARGSTADTALQLAFFESKIRPLLVEHCCRCHGGEKQKSDLRLDTWAGIEQGGAAGPAIVPGKPEQSLLIAAVGYQDSDLRMPPDKKLSPQQIDDLVAWVKMGAPHPDADNRVRKVGVRKRDETNWESEQDFWSLRPVVVPDVPAVRNAGWGNGAIDTFVLAGLEQKGLAPALRADKRTLLRRVTFDLIGMPPTPAEIEAFLRDDSPQAFENVVDRLLASPHYGERWGRHWLDVARYADSNGLDENLAFGNAWRYRDYVIAAFNNDKPYDRFLTEQLAGDLLPCADDRERSQLLIATGFLSLGAKVLAEVDATKMEMDIIDEQVDTFGRAVLALTLGCARCHDHKFDPIGADDYYALAGIFKSTRTMEHFTKIARWHEHQLGTDEERRRVAEINATLVGMRALLKQKTAAAASNDKKEPLVTSNIIPQAQEPVPTKAEIESLRKQIRELETAANAFPATMGVTEGTPADVPIHIRGSHLTLGEIVPRGFPRVLSRDSSHPIDRTSSGRLQLAQWLVDARHPLTSRVIVNRIWHWHFGKGLSRSPDNFGRMGDPPDHPQLLDWLSAWFVRDGWSIKRLHRLILLSSTYQMSSGFDARAAEIDPENILLWRMDVRRLEAEEIRDSLLAVSGDLDAEMGGALLRVNNREFVFNHLSKDETKYDSLRRSIYLPVIRNALYDVFQLFDSTDATVMNGDRATSTVAPQALFWLNSELVLNAADRLAEQVCCKTHAAGADRVRRLYLTLFGRLPTDVEVARALAFVNRPDFHAGDAPGIAARDSWAELCRVLLASNEFVFVR